VSQCVLIRSPSKVCSFKFSLLFPRSFSKKNSNLKIWNLVKKKEDASARTGGQSFEKRKKRRQQMVSHVLALEIEEGVVTHS